jgi:hypothetical protein
MPEEFKPDPAVPPQAARKVIAPAPVKLKDPPPMFNQTGPSIADCEGDFEVFGDPRYFRDLAVQFAARQRQQKTK